MSAFSGLTNIQVNTGSLADGQSIAAYLTDAAGALLTSTLNGAKQSLDVYGADAWAENTAHVLGSIGSFSLAVRQDVEGTIATADGNYAPLQVDTLGRLRVNADINVNNDFVYAEDAAAVSGNLGASILSVRQNTLATDTSADGDYSFIKSTALGEVYVFDTTTHTGLTTVNSTLGTTNTTLASILTDLNNLSHAEDAAHVSGDIGMLPLAVRNDTPGSLVSANGDYAPLQVDATGNLRVVGSFTFGGEYAEDSASASGDTGLFALGIRRDTTGTNTSASGDYSEIQTWSNGELKVVDIANLAILQQQVSVTNTAAAVPATPLANRKVLLLQNTGANKLYIGSATVTTSGVTTGIELPANNVMELEVGPAAVVFAVKVGATGNNLNVLEMS